MARLIATWGGSEARVIDLPQGRITVGRKPDNSIVLDHSSISAVHCILLPDNDDFMVRDLISTNGTRVNGKPVEEAILQHGDMLKIGAIEFLFDDRGGQSGSDAGTMNETVKIDDASLVRAVPEVPAASLPSPEHDGKTKIHPAKPATLKATPGPQPVMLPPIPRTHRAPSCPIPAVITPPPEAPEPTPDDPVDEPEPALEPAPAADPLAQPRPPEPPPAMPVAEPEPVPAEPPPAEPEPAAAPVDEQATEAPEPEAKTPQAVPVNDEPAKATEDDSADADEASDAAPAAKGKVLKRKKPDLSKLRAGRKGAAKGKPLAPKGMLKKRIVIKKKPRADG